jgi:hypothetical protein
MWAGPALARAQCSETAEGKVMTLNAVTHPKCR